MAIGPENSQVHPDTASDSQSTREIRLARKRETLLANLAEARLTTLHTRVAWLLNHLPETRDSDITLQIRYWEQFEAEIFTGRDIPPDDLYRLTRLTSLARARATIQNTHGLFLASEEIRLRRGTLQEEEREEAGAIAAAALKSFSIYSDESGKTADNLIVGSLWLLNGIESRSIHRSMEEWREAGNFESELHFVRIGRGNQHRYHEALDILHQHSAALCFKAVVLPRVGLGNLDDALNDMLYHLIVRGVRHEEESGRATLPRTLQLWKDAENEATDQLRLANLNDRLKQASANLFDGNLVVNHLFSADSRSNIFLQFADLFVSSVNRSLNNPGNNLAHPKDQFARAFLERFGVSRTEDALESGRDVTVFEDI